MKVETFEIFSSIDVDSDVKKEEIELIRELDLAGQKDMENHTNPYRQMGKDEQFIFERVLDTRTDISKYKESPIPLHVLQIIQHARSLNIFMNFSIWHSHRSQPILVSLTETYGKPYILARWGEELDSMEYLKGMAVSMARHKCIGKAKKMKSDIESYMNTIKQLTDEELLYSDLNLDPSLYC